MARVVLDGLGRVIGDTSILQDFSLTLEDGELVTVLGPSGCGKSTLLRLVAGLDELSSGTIRIGERRVDGLPPQERDVAMVFQSYALYPHLTVRGNVEFPLRMRGLDASDRRRQVDRVAALVEIAELLDRKPAALSGGQRQRVALARALVREPALFLLDEPLSNLDARLRASVRRSIRDVQRTLGVTTLYVTHDQTEAMTLGDRIVVLEAGRIQQCGAPLEVYERPDNAFVAGFVGTPPMNLLPALLRDGVLQLGAQVLSASAALRGSRPPADGRVLVGIRAEAFTACPDDLATDATSHVVATVDAASREVLGGETLLRATVADTTITVRLFGNVATPPARVAAPADDVHLFAADDGRRLGP